MNKAQKFVVATFSILTSFLAIAEGSAIASEAAKAATEVQAALATVAVEMRDMPRVYRLDGVAEATQKATVSAETSGRVEKILFDVDDFVERGDLLLVLNDSQQQAALTQAQANVSLTLARKQEAQKEYTRIKGVYDKKAVAKADMDKAIAALKSARANYESALAALSQAEEQLAYTQVKAPYTGIVTERLIEVGEVAQPGRRLMSGISLQKMRVNVNAPQNLVNAIREYRQAHILLGKHWVKAEKLTIFPVADRGSNTFKVRLDLPEGESPVFPGMHLKTAFVTGMTKAMVIPKRTVVFRSEVVGVYVVNESGDVRLRHIRLGASVDQENITVLSGLDQGEQLAVDPVAAVKRLKDQRAGGQHE